MENISLSGPECPPISGNPAKQLIVFLHGFGADGRDLVTLSQFFATDFPDAHFIAPNAPFPCEMSPVGHQWFSLRDWSSESLLKGANEVAPILNLFLDTQLKRLHLKDENLALIGFSQGTMMSLFVALRRPKPCAGVVGFSGSLIGETGVVSKPPICLIHGNDDMVVPYGAMTLAEAILKHHGVPVEAHTRDGLGHGIDQEGLDIAVDFLKKNLK